MNKMLKLFSHWRSSIGRIIVIAGSLVIVACEPVALERVESLESQQKMNLTQDGQEGEQVYQLPAWFEEHRVQGHTRLSVKKWLGTPEFTNGATGFAQLGAVVFSRHVKTGKEDPWWPSKVPVTGNGQPLLIDRPNHIKQMIEQGRAKGMRTIAYYFHSTDKTIANLHPEWVCKQPNGKVVAHRRRGDYLDITSPYREIVLQRLLELAEMGVDGFFFDEVHMPYNGCWGTPLQEAFRQGTGREAPTVIDDRDPDYRRYLQFTASQVEETFAYWRETVHRQYPEVVFQVSTTTVPALINPRMTTKLVRLADSPKSEFFLAIAKRLNMRVFEENPSLAQPADDIRMALGWTLLRDAADGRPPRIGGGGLPNREQALAFASALVTYGAIANMGVSEVNLLTQKSSDHGTPREGLKSAFELGQRVSPYLSQSRPVRWAAVHYSERSRDRRGVDLVAAWRQVLWPLTGAFQVLVRDGVPVGVVNDYQLQKGQLKGYKLLFLPNPDELTIAQGREVDRFRAKGGIVIENDPRWTWSQPGETGKAMAAFRQVYSEYRDTAPVRVTGGPEKMHAVAFQNPDKSRLVVAITNDFTWIRFRRNIRRGQQSLKSPPPLIRDVEVEIKTDRPPGRVLEVITGQVLQPEAIMGGYKVRLPEFSPMAMLAIE